MPFFSRGSIAGPACDPNNYTLVGGPPLCSGSDYICAVQASNDGSNRPVITKALAIEMVQALESGGNTTNVGLKN